jgi:hypothetical protein
MALSLSVPVSDTSLPKEIEANPKKARAWVESLPLTKTIDSARQVAQNLEAFNRAKLPAEERIELFEVYRPIVMVLLDELEAIYAYSSLPLPAKQREAFDIARQLRTESCYAYKILILEKSAKRILFNAKKALPPAICRALILMRGTMLQSYKTYHPVPAGVWQEVHSLFMYAEEQDLLGEVGDEADKLTVLDIYVEMLMMALADPYRLMFKEVEKVDEFLAQNRGLVDIRASSEGLDPLRLFVMALDSDQAPKVLVQGNRPPAGQILRLVDPRRLVERLQQKIKAAGGGATAAKSRAMHDLNDLYVRLTRLWGDPPKRQFRRNPADSGVALCSGVKAIAFFAEQAANEDPEADAQAIRDGDTVPLLKIPQDPMSQLIGVEEWHVLNQSANGLRLHRDTPGNVGVTVGEAVGIRFVGGRSWNLGVVRWLTLLEGNALEFGVELMAPAVDSVTVEPTIGGNKPLPALMLIPVMPEALPDTLVTLPDTFADLREFELNDHGEITHVRATTLYERTSRFDMFQVQPS